MGRAPVKWPWKRREVRSRGYEASILSAWEASAESRIGANPASLAVVSACARVWADALSACAVTGPPALSGRFLAALGQDLIRRGVSRWKISIQGGAIVLERPARAQRVSRGWLLSWNRDPADTDTERVLDSEVLNLVWEHVLANDWDGIAPWYGLTGRFLAELDSVAGDQASGPAGHLLSISDGGGAITQLRNHGAAMDAVEEVGQAAEMLDRKPRIEEGSLSGKRRGGMASIISSGGYVTTGDNANSIRPARVEYAPGEGLASNRKQLVAEIAAAAGVPIPLLTGEGGAAIREAQRSFGARLQARANLIAGEIERALAVPVSIDASGVFRADIMMRSRALKSMTEAGISLEDARGMVGL